MKTNYFAKCNTLDDAKNLFRRLVFELHPDTSGYKSEPDFVRMYKEFDEFRPIAEHARKGDEDFNVDVFYNIVKRFEELENVLVTFVGSFIWLEDSEGHEGSTKSQKEDIKGIIIEGFNKPRFSGKRCKWYYSPEGYKQKFKSKKSFEELKFTWGHKTYDNKAFSDDKSKEKKAEPQLSN